MTILEQTVLIRLLSKEALWELFPVETDRSKDYCGARHPTALGQWVCTRSRDHDGPHVRHGEPDSVTRLPTVVECWVNYEKGSLPWDEKKEKKE